MSRFQKAMVWLGLTDAEEDEDQYDDYEESPPRRTRHYRAEAPVPPSPRVQVFQTSPEQSRDDRDNIRHLNGDRFAARPGGSDYEQPRHENYENRASDPRASFVKPVPAEKPKLHLSQPHRFSDVQEIGDSFKERQLVVVDLANLSKDLSRRVIDFCSGVTYSLEGRIEKLSDVVLLLSPANIELSVQDKDKLMERLLLGTGDR